MVKNLPAMKEIRVQSLGREDPLEKGMAIHSSILAWYRSSEISNSTGQGTGQSNEAASLAHLGPVWDPHMLPQASELGIILRHFHNCLDSGSRGEGWVKWVQRNKP